MGTHYSTTHPPPLSQNSTSSSSSSSCCCSFSFPFPCLRLRRSRVSLSLSLLRIPGPLFPTSRWLVLQPRTTFGPLSAPLSLFLSVHSCAHPARCTAKLFRMYSYIAHVLVIRVCVRACVCACWCVRARTHARTCAHTCAQAKHTYAGSSFHPISRLILLSYSAGPSSFFFFFVPPRSVTPACNGRPRILLISWHATLSPCSAFISLRRLYPPLRYSLLLPLPLLSVPSVILRPSPRTCEGPRESFLPSTRSRSLLAVVVLSSLSLSRLPLVYIAPIRASLDASSPTSVPLVHRDSVATAPSVRRGVVKSR